ncbi:MAG: tyrosine--tRNA ligase [Chloroflexota bacterium]|nr:MAG: tyrosine--tRNA ligase [Chloroflexota bacterium]
MENAFDVLEERGFVQQASEPDKLKVCLEHPVTLYNGIDATARSLHVGHLVPIMMMSWFQRCGHRPIALVGGGTTLVGDPTGRTSSRPILSEDAIEQNVEAIRCQLERFLDFDEGHALLLNNVDWLKPLSFVGFMRDIGSRFSVNELLRLEAYRARLEAGGLSFLEFTYVLMQSYDFLQLFQKYDCVLQIGGSDQWGNSIAGAGLVRRVTGGEAYVLVSPLLGMQSGVKMGKTTGGALWLDPSMTSPYDYYQYFRNTADADVENRLAIFTFLPMGRVRELGGLRDVEVNRAKEILAFEATKLVHGEVEAQRAQDAARALFGGEGSDEAVPAIEVARSRLAVGIPVTELFKEAGLVNSANEARQRIREGGLSVNGERVTDPQLRLDLSPALGGHLMLSLGRKRHVRVLVV